MNPKTLHQAAMKLDPNALKIYTFITSVQAMENKPYIVMTHSFIAADTGISLAQVKYYTDQLVHDGWLQREEHIIAGQRATAYSSVFF